MVVYPRSCFVDPASKMVLHISGPVLPMLSYVVKVVGLQFSYLEQSRDLSIPLPHLNLTR